MGNHKALIVEDERDMAIEIADLLQSMGYDHATVDNLADARRLLEEGGFCFVLLDLQIKNEKYSIRPRVEAGMTFLRELRQKHPRRGNNDMHLLPVIVVSGHAKEHEDIVRAFQAGANDFVRKPLGQFGQDLSAKIAACLDRSGRYSHVACLADDDEIASARNPVNIEHTADYREVRFKGDLYLFGEIQGKVIRRLHEASKTDNPWVSGKTVLRYSGSGDSASKLANLFRRHEAWQKLVLSNGRGEYRLADG